jgi:hypothetical protein
VSEGPDLGAHLAALDHHGVAYVVCGSVGAMAHGAPDVTPGDLDIVPDTRRANLERLAAALAELGAEAGREYGEWRIDELGEREWVQDGRLRETRPLDPADPSTFDHWFETPHGRLDVVPEAAGTFAKLRARARAMPLAGADRWVAHPVDLLTGMTRPRRAKDVPRVRHLRDAAVGEGVGFVGFRTDRFDEMVGLFRDLVGLSVMRETPGATWFRLGTDAELHVYADSDPDHVFFTTGPVVGLRVDNVDATRARMGAAGLQMLTDVERTETLAWFHFRAPDGTVLEIIGPA